MKIVQHRSVVQVGLEEVTWRERLRRWRSFIAWRLRPKFLKCPGGPIRLRWWICYRLMQRLDKQIRAELALGRKLMFDHHDAGRSSPDWMRGKNAANRARVLEARMLWLAYEGGSQFFDGSSRIELLEFAGMDIKRDIRKAR